MKKIGIVTFYPNNNYGCILQAFSLQKCLNELGYDADVISFEPNWKYYTKKRDVLHILYAVYLYLQRHLNLKKWKFPKIKTSKLYHFVSDIESNEYDCLIAGSDQIWHPRCFAQLCGGYNFYFLNFCSDDKKRVAYAPSMSVRQWPDDFVQLINPMLKKFHAISVREKSSEMYLKKLGYEHVACVCDPTILHDARFYIKEFDLLLNERKHLFVFLIRENISNELIQGFLCAKKVLSMKKQKTVYSIQGWLSAIYNAKYVITDSFHCCVFCLLFHRNFLLLKNKSVLSEMNERFVSLLDVVGLRSRLVDDLNSEMAKRILNERIDWDKVDCALEDFRMNSFRWLKNALES